MTVRANAIKLRHSTPVDLCATPGGVPVGQLFPGDLLMPAGLECQSDDSGCEYIAVIVWVPRDEVMRGTDE